MDNQEIKPKKKYIYDTKKYYKPEYHKKRYQEKKEQYKENVYKHRDKMKKIAKFFKDKNIDIEEFIEFSECLNIT